MDIKSKNSIIYRLCLLLCIVLLGVSFIAVIDIIKNNKYLDNNYYFNTYEFKKDLVEYFSNVQILNTKFKDNETKSPELKVTQEDILSQKKVYESQFENAKEAISNSYLYQINKAGEEKNTKLKKFPD